VARLLEQEEPSINVGQQLMERGIICPLVSATTFAMLPLELKDVRLLGGDRIDFSKAWKPETD
jgi:hypothetical protein